MTGARVGRTTSAPGRPRAPERPRLGGTPLLLILAHLLLGPAMFESPAIATLHAVATLSVAGWWAVSSRRIDRLACAAAYVASCDVLWRMTKAGVFWEAGKYGVVLVLGLALVRLVRRPGAGMGLPFAYFAVLVPSALLILFEFGPVGAREQLSFNLSGPLALAVSVAFFSRIRTDWADLRRVLHAMLLPITTIGGVALYRVLTGGKIDFGTASNKATSGDFGPNQVSAILGLGALVCLFLVLREPRPRGRLLYAVLGLWFFGQSTLTFSRGGALNLVIAGGCIALLQFAQSGRRLRTLFLLSILVLGGCLVFARIDAFTGGALQKRFDERSTTGRSTLVQSDVAIFRSHVVAGVGPGQSRAFREDSRLAPDAAHTEFSRLLAEHGLLGASAIGLLLVMFGRAVARAQSRWAQTLSVSFGVWAIVEMLHAAMRLAATSFTFGLAMVYLTETGTTRAPRAGSSPSAKAPPP